MKTTFRSGLHPSLTRWSAHLRFAVSVATIFVFMAKLGVAQAPKDSPSVKPKSVILFDGKSLAGWTKTDFVNSGEVKVEDGAIVMPVAKK